MTLSKKEIQIHINVYRDVNGQLLHASFDSKIEADKNRMLGRVACLEYNRSFKDGEGL